MKIQGPESVKEKYREMLQDAMGDMYGYMAGSQG